ncbi:uncharacterized protein MYCFIDRAFT_179268 [Pseudocercospora fijiensis CIRAD86]|uniref:Uncharacterized protein n=1 Tax=Pseudocercospora fijiensis (strain CIRAD86) TaxID=383855 RepID=M3AKX4_PSEFD|nr:uncharacterized protein MYCFIDRAFT_179268 [Pseudocercospora fijiensis CIRAD86]EME77778.1 hypothetical protein MYCFIDRAFT_179268 [Pseudocercospora fijiensis CIRAD86]
MLKRTTSPLPTTTSYTRAWLAASTWLLSESSMHQADLPFWKARISDHGGEFEESRKEREACTMHDARQEAVLSPSTTYQISSTSNAPPLLLLRLSDGVVLKSRSQIWRWLPLPALLVFISLEVLHRYPEFSSPSPPLLLIRMHSLHPGRPAKSLGVVVDVGMKCDLEISRLKREQRAELKAITALTESLWNPRLQQLVAYVDKSTNNARTKDRGMARTGSQNSPSNGEVISAHCISWDGRQLLESDIVPFTTNQQHLMRLYRKQHPPTLRPRYYVLHPSQIGNKHFKLKRLSENKSKIGPALPMSQPETPSTTSQSSALSEQSTVSTPATEVSTSGSPAPGQSTSSYLESICIGGVKATNDRDLDFQNGGLYKSVSPNFRAHFENFPHPLTLAEHSALLYDKQSSSSRIIMDSGVATVFMETEVTGAPEEIKTFLMNEFKFRREKGVWRCHLHHGMKGIGDHNQLFGR